MADLSVQPDFYDLPKEVKEENKQTFDETKKKDEDYSKIWNITCPSDTENPSEDPSVIPSEDPSEIPSEDPSEIPSEDHSVIPSDNPSEIPSENPQIPEINLAHKSENSKDNQGLVVEASLETKELKGDPSKDNTLVQNAKEDKDKEEAKENKSQRSEEKSQEKNEKAPKSTNVKTGVESLSSVVMGLFAASLALFKTKKRK